MLCYTMLCYLFAGARPQPFPRLFLGAAGLGLAQVALLLVRRPAAAEGTEQNSTVQYSTVQYSTVYRTIELCIIILYERHRLQQV